jgi:hypothetical protein
MSRQRIIAKIKQLAMELNGTMKQLAMSMEEFGPKSILGEFQHLHALKPLSKETITWEILSMVNNLTSTGPFLPLPIWIVLLAITAIVLSE